MAPKRSVRIESAANNNKNYNNLRLNDVLCPICRSILIKPVTLPCNHGFCSSCFDGTVANANLVCPLCRVRISSWLRRSSRNDKLVNKALWDAIQKYFPTQVQNKLAGNEEYIDEDAPRRLTRRGEIRREYEVQKAKDLLELQKEREAESKASLEYIQKLKKQEEEEERVYKQNLELSETVAKKLAQDYTYNPGPSSSKKNLISKNNNNSKKQMSIDTALKKMNNKKRAMVTVQPKARKSLKEYKCKILCQGEPKKNEPQLFNWKTKGRLRKLISEVEASDSNDSLVADCTYFKPIDQRFPRASNKAALVKVPAIVASANTVIIGPPKGEMKFTHADVGSAFASMKRLTLNTISVLEGQHSPLISNSPELEIDLSNTIITKLMEPAVNGSPKSSKESPKEQQPEILEMTPRLKKYKGRNNLNNISQDLTGKTSTCNSFIKPSKRKSLSSSPIIENCVSSKKSKISNNANKSNSPFSGINNSNLNELKRKTNGEITVKTINIDSTSSDYQNEKVNEKLKRVQEEKDFKLAQKLHLELNSRSRYSKRNSINSIHNNKIRKTPARQVTLKKMISSSTVP